MAPDRSSAISSAQTKHTTDQQLECQRVLRHLTFFNEHIQSLRQEMGFTLVASIVPGLLVMPLEKTTMQSDHLECRRSQTMIQRHASHDCAAHTCRAQHTTNTKNAITIVTIFILI